VVDKVAKIIAAGRGSRYLRIGREISMAKIDLDALCIEELAALRDSAIEKLAEKVAARQAELESELEKLSQYGKLAKKSQAVAVAKPKKEKDDSVKDSIARAA
jgi:hypothetical protein